MAFLDRLPKPIFILAPMDDVTDSVFRQIVADLAPPDLYFTEFVNVDGLQSPGREKLLKKLQFTEKERPIIAQLWGLNPENFYKTVKELIDGTLVAEANALQGKDEKRRELYKEYSERASESLTPQGVASAGGVAGSAGQQARALRGKRMGFDGVDLNMGCPVKTVIKNGACAALINNRELAGEIIDAAIEAAESGSPRSTQGGAAQGEDAERKEVYREVHRVSTSKPQRSDASPSIGGVAGSAGQQAKAVRAPRDFPVSVKTRVGFNNIDLEWIEFLLSKKLDLLSIHGRTAKQLSKVPADWDLIGQARELRDVLCPATLITGNGDVMNHKQGLELAKKYKLDGIMIGRGVFLDPFVFAQQSPWGSFTKAQRLRLYEKHIELFSKTWQKGEYRYDTLKKFCKVYISDFPGAAELRAELMKTQSAYEALTLLTRA